MFWKASLAQDDFKSTFFSKKKIAQKISRRLFLNPRINPRGISFSKKNDILPKLVPLMPENHSGKVCMSMMIPLFLLFSMNRVHFPADKYLLKINNDDTRERYEICQMLTMLTPERRSLTSALNILYFFLVCLLLSLNK